MRAPHLLWIYGLVVVAGVVAASAASAQPTGPSRLDTNSDGRVSRAEFMTGFLADALKYDKDGDGRVTRGELPMAARMPGMTKVVDQMFKTIDSSGDGVLSRAEFTARGDVRFREADVNGDGAIDAAELKIARQQR